MRRWAVLFMSGLMLLAGDAPVGSQQKKPNQLAKIMTEKLSNAKVLLEGIAMNDFKKIERAADELHLLSRTAEWQAYNTPKYEMHSNEFRRAAEGIAQKAKMKNIDGVTLAYFEMTMSCVRCHQYVREVRDAALPRPPAELPEFVPVSTRRVSR